MKPILLTDNGSLQPAATLRLRALADKISRILGRPVTPVSVLHSDKIDPALLNGTPAATFEPYARQRHAEGVGELDILPLFIGPSLALTEFLPERAQALGVRLNMLPTLWSPGNEDALVELLLDHLKATGWTPGSGTVLLCDHGSPIREVTAAREDLAARLRQKLNLSTEALLGCAMERRAGPEYAFNEPMLADAMARAQGKVVVLMLFILPGRHAGPGGDVATLCAQHAPANVTWQLSPLLGEHPQLATILAHNYRSRT
jgi:sirohydrochlorin ferrochelatase